MWKNCRRSFRFSGGSCPELYRFLLSVRVTDSVLGSTETRIGVFQARFLFSTERSDTPGWLVWSQAESGRWVHCRREIGLGAPFNAGDTYRSAIPQQGGFDPAMKLSAWNKRLRATVLCLWDEDDIVGDALDPRRCTSLRHRYGKSEGGTCKITIRASNAAQRVPCDVVSS